MGKVEEMQEQISVLQHKAELAKIKRGELVFELENTQARAAELEEELAKALRELGATATALEEERKRNRDADPILDFLERNQTIWTTFEDLVRMSHRSLEELALGMILTTIRNFAPMGPMVLNHRIQMELTNL